MKKATRKLVLKMRHVDGATPAAIAKALGLTLAEVQAELSKKPAATAAPAKPAADTAARADLRRRMKARAIAGRTNFQIACEFGFTEDEVCALIDPRNPNMHAYGFTILPGGSAIGPSPKSIPIGYGAGAMPASNFPADFGGKRRS
jgi:hypothetical protein